MMDQGGLWQAITAQSHAHWQRYQSWLGEVEITPANTLAIVIVGAPGVGKSSLLRQLIHPLPVPTGTTRWPVSIVTPDPSVVWTDTPGWTHEHAPVIHTALAQADVCFWVMTQPETAPSELATTLKNWGRPVVQIINLRGGEPPALPPAHGNFISTITVRLSPYSQPLRTEWPDGRVEWTAVTLPVDVTAAQTVLQHLLAQQPAIRCINRLMIMANRERQWAMQPGQTPILWAPILVKSLLLTLMPGGLWHLMVSVGTDLLTLLWLSRHWHLPITRHGIQRVVLALGFSSGSVAILGLSNHLDMGGVSHGLWGGITSYGLQRVARTYLSEGITWASDGPNQLLQQIYRQLTPGTWFHTWVESLVNPPPSNE
ncbi:MAG: GTPase domain-containing protein [Gloeomargarita sp. HHBFW_bins_162]